ncbi:hypothetical protein N9924_00065 [bacterium]|nr:hypothetical protein [bacterium]
MAAAVAAAAAAVVTAGTGIYQMYQGNKQRKRAEEMQQDYAIPQEILDRLSTAEIQALEGMPAAQKAQYIQNLQGSTQSGINAFQDRKSGLSGVEGILRNEQNSFNNLATQDALTRNNNIQNLQNVRLNQAGFQDKKYDMNIYQPYMAKLAEAEAMSGAGMQNINNAMNTGVQNYQDQQFYKDIIS